MNFNIFPYANNNGIIIKPMFIIFYQFLFQKLLIQKLMAFVYRSEKQSLFDRQKQQQVQQKPEMISNQQSQLNGTSYINQPFNHTFISPGKVITGLPSLVNKDKTTQPDPLFEKQNKIFQDTKQSIKFNQQKLKRITQNYFFSSNVSRDANLFSSKLLNKSLTCNQFSTPSGVNKQNAKAKKQFVAHMACTFVVNRNLVDSKSAIDFRKTSTQVNSRNTQIDKIMIDCSKQNESSIKRKSSPPQSSNNLFLKRANELKKPDRQKIFGEQSEIFIKTLNQTTKITLKGNLTQKKLIKLHKGNLQGSFYKESDSQESSEKQQYDHQNDIPGPGTYNNTINLKDKKSFRSRKEKFANIFVSPLERFKNNLVKYQEITQINEKKSEKIRQNPVFLSKTPKNLQIELRRCSPPLGMYNPRDSMEHDIVRNLLRSPNVPNFNSSLPRFNYSQQSCPSPGPGYYNHDILEHARQEEIRSQLSSSYKSQVKRSFDIKQVNVSENQNKEKNEIFDKQADHSVIHRRQQHFDSSEFFTSPPFFSSVQRFQQTQNIDKSSSCKLKIQIKSSSKESKNLQPFNSSQKRNFSQNVGQSVGVGSYLIEKDRWNKKSYNVHFH